MNGVDSNLPTQLFWENQGLPKPHPTVLGKDDFLKLFMAQLKNQDPLKPMEQHEFASQLAQFSSLEQLQNIQSGIKGLQTAQGDATKFRLQNYLGKHVEAKGASVDHVEGASTTVPLAGFGDAQIEKVSLLDSSGQVVRVLDASHASDGHIAWDGKGEKGDVLPTGQYHYVVHGVDKAGNSIVLGGGVSGTVTQVVLDGATPKLLVSTQGGTQKVVLSDLTSVGADAPLMPQPGPRVADPTAGGRFVAPEGASLVPQNSPSPAPNGASEEVQTGSNVPLPVP